MIASLFPASRPPIFGGAKPEIALSVADDMSETFCTYESRMRETIIQFFVEQGFHLTDLCSDNEVTRRTAAQKHSDDLMQRLGRIRESYGSSF